jgi:VWFA-related protein
MTRLIGLFLALLIPVGTAVSQNEPASNPPQQNMPQPQLHPRLEEPANVPVPTDRQIRLDVQVSDKSGAPVRGLQKEDFTVLDDKRPQSILSFHAADSGTPADSVEIVLVIDAVNAGFQSVSYERNEVRKFLLQNGGKLAQPTSIVFFADAGAKMQDRPSRDGNNLVSLYEQFETGLRTVNRSQGFYGAADRLELSLKTLSQLTNYEKARPGRKLVIWFSPGWPLLTGPSIQLTQKDEQHFFQSIVEASTGLRQARITLYSIDPLGLADAGGIRLSYYEQFLKGVSNPTRAQAANLSLQVLCVQSGGRVLNGSNDLTQELATAASDANAFYVLSFEGARADHPDEYHAIEVNLDKPGVKARTRTGYYAQP